MKMNKENRETVETTDALIEIVKDHAIREYPHECCGILIGTHGDDGSVTVRDVKSADNRTDNEGSGRHFIIDPMEIYGYEKELDGSGLEIIGFYHSHPDAPAVLSTEDEEGMIPGQVFMILSAAGDGQTAREVTECTAWIKTDNIVNNIEFSLKEES